MTYALRLLGTLALIGWFAMQQVTGWGVLNTAPLRIYVALLAPLLDAAPHWQTLLSLYTPWGFVVSTGTLALVSAGVSFWSASRRERALLIECARTAQGGVSVTPI